MPVKHTAMREDFSIINTAQFSAERTDDTIQLALDAIGSDHAELLLADEDDGVWTITNDITLPNNVFLRVPFGVTIQGPGNITILGGSLAMRWPVHLGPGTLSGTTAIHALSTSRLNAGYTTVYYLDVLTEANVTGDMHIGPPLLDFETPDGVRADYKHTIVHRPPATAYLGALLGLVVDQYVLLTGESRNQPRAAYVQTTIDPAGFRLIHEAGTWGAMHGISGGSYVSGYTGGIVDFIIGLQGFAINNATTVEVGQAFNIWAYTPTPGAPTSSFGVIKRYYAFIADDAYGLTGGTEFCAAFYSSQSNRYSTDWNIHVAAGAPSFFGSSVGILKRPAYPLEVNGQAGTPGGVWVNTTSSQDLKRQVEPLTHALSTLLRLRGRRWSWKADLTLGTSVMRMGPQGLLLPSVPQTLNVRPGPQLGLILEEVEEVLPEWIVTADDGTRGLCEAGSLGLIVEALRELNTRLTAVEGNTNG